MHAKRGQHAVTFFRRLHQVTWRHSQRRENRVDVQRAESGFLSKRKNRVGSMGLSPVTALCNAEAEQDVRSQPSLMLVAAAQLEHPCPVSSKGPGWHEVYDYTLDMRRPGNWGRQMTAAKEHRIEPVKLGGKMAVVSGRWKRRAQRHLALVLAQHSPIV